MKKLLLIAVCCLMLCGCSPTTTSNTNENDTSNSKSIEIEEDKKMCCMYYGGTIKNGNCENIVDEKNYNICLNKIDDEE